MELQSSIERISSVECRVKVEIPWSEVSGRLDDKMRDLRRRARLPGFRPGKVPPNVIEKMYGKSIRSELANDLVQETFQTAVAQHEATPLTQPVLYTEDDLHVRQFTDDKTRKLRTGRICAA